MARPIKKSIDYFSFDSDFFDDDKIKKLRIRFRADGIAVYLHLICHIYRENGYYLILDEDAILELSDLFKIDIEQIDAIIKYCISINLFIQTELINKCSVITNERVQRNYMSATKTRGKKNEVSVSKKIWLLSAKETEDYIIVEN